MYCLKIALIFFCLSTICNAVLSQPIKRNAYKYHHHNVLIGISMDYYYANRNILRVIKHRARKKTIHFFLPLFNFTSSVFCADRQSALFFLTLSTTRAAQPIFVPGPNVTHEKIRVCIIKCNTSKNDKYTFFSLFGFF